ncbi:Wzz/FepE/Etk N-terminal domain-containing protein [Planococcus sp. N028]|uniref:Wzz/FepE/Etk N-terminal domain-containing protein n=1 Tax=Planococcus shixiaomingii TaxID=3058393 RepID=A0ABT8N287_9BACL|nr:Wzz/FepE/Etk N-terminal domain-containing protein [Planococcus sp. N028]MDN7241670.1 Wzz/FepE/Etk N-terminal domain-containing protein [Planococcus sp. N028]
MEETISLHDLFKTIRKRLSLIILLTLFVIIITGIVSYFVLTPVYQASTEILVNQSPAESGQLINQNIQTDLQLINTYSGIIKSPVILDQVIEGMNLDMTTDQLTEKITVSNDEQSQIVNIAVQDNDVEMAVKIANSIASIFENDIKNLMNVDNVTILSPAVLKEDPVPVFPKPMLNMAIAAVVGLMLGVGIAFLLEYLDTTIKDQQDIEDILGIPLVGVISPIAEKAEIGQDDKTASKAMGGIKDGQKEKASPADSR